MDDGAKTAATAISKDLLERFADSNTPTDVVLAALTGTLAFFIVERSTSHQSSG